MSLRELPRWKTNVMKIPSCARTPFLGLQRHESSLPLRLDDPESCQNTIPETSVPRVNVTVAP
eukprot:6508759-Pyramimonas_sp.AAC.1